MSSAFAARERPRIVLWLHFLRRAPPAPKPPTGLDRQQIARDLGALPPALRRDIGL